MLDKREIGTFAVIVLVLAITISFLKSAEIFLNILLAIFIIFFLNIAAKKIAAYYLDSEIEIKPWQMQRYGFKKSSYFKKPIPIGIILPIIISVLSLGRLLWMAAIVFEVKPKVYRAAKRHGLYSFSEMTEAHIGLIAAAGIFANLLFAVIGYLIGYTDFARLNVFAISSSQPSHTSVSLFNTTK